MSAPPCLFCNPRASQRCSLCEARLLAEARAAGRAEAGGPHDGVRIDRLARVLQAVFGAESGELVKFLDVTAAELDAAPPARLAWRCLAEHFLRELHAPYGTLPPGDKPQT